MSDKLASYMKSHGYETWHTGGGCMAWRRDEAGFYTMITDLDGTALGEWKDRNKPEWLVGRYLDEDENFPGAWVVYETGVTLDKALEIAHRLPDPKAGDEVGLSSEEQLRAPSIERFADPPNPGVLTIDEFNHAQCDCGVVGFEVIFNDLHTEVRELECVSCGATYQVTEEERRLNR